MLIGGPHFLPLVELLLLPSFPPFLPPSLSLFKNKCHIPAISYLLCWQPQWPVEDLPPRNLSTPGGGLFTQCWLGVPCSAPVTCDLSPAHPSPFTLSLSFLSFFLFPALLFGPRPSRSLSLFSPALHLLHSLSPAHCGSLKHPQWNRGGGAALRKPGQHWCKSVMVFTALP